MAILAGFQQIIARVTDRIITRSDYDRALADMDREASQRGATSMQEISAGHKDLLRNLIEKRKAWSDLCLALSVASRPQG